MCPVASFKEEIQILAPIHSAYNQGGGVAGSVTMSVSKNSMNCSLRSFCDVGAVGVSKYEEFTDHATGESPVLLEGTGQTPVLELAKASNHSP